MKSFHKIKNIRYTDDKLYLTIDGKDFSFYLDSLSKKLMKATVAEFQNFIVSPSGYGIHWPILDEDISIEGLLKFSKNQKSKKKVRIVT